MKQLEIILREIMSIGMVNITQEKLIEFNYSIACARYIPRKDRVVREKSFCKTYFGKFVVEYIAHDEGLYKFKEMKMVCS